MGVDIGTTSVKALAVDEDGRELARSRVPHRVLAPEPDVLRHDARAAWHRGPKKAYANVVEQLARLGHDEVAGVAVASMVPSMTAVNKGGLRLCPASSTATWRADRPINPPISVWGPCPTPRGSCDGPPLQRRTLEGIGPARPWPLTR